MVAADVSAFLMFGAFFSFIFLGSLLMQQLLRYSPTRAGVGWLATSIVAFLAAGATGARLATKFGVRQLIVVGLSLLAIGVLWLTRIPVGADYVTDILPAFVLAGLAIGLSAPTVQIGALSGVSGASAGLASGLVETMREIGGAVGIAAVSTVLVSRTNDALQASTPAAQQAASFDAFQSAFVVIVVLAALGAIVAAIGFPRARATAKVVTSTKQDRPIGYWLRQAERAFTKQLNEMLVSQELTRVHWQILNFVNGNDSTSRGEVHEALGTLIGSKRLDGALTELVRRGWFDRTRSGNQSVYLLTDEGRQGRDDVIRRAGRVGRRAINGITETEHQAAIGTLERIIRNLDGNEPKRRRTA
jgi:fucose permease